MTISTSEPRPATLGELASLVGGELDGDPDLPIRGVNEIDAAGPDEIVFIAKAAMLEKLATCRAAAVVAPRGTDTVDRPLIRVRDPYLAIARIHNHFTARPFVAAGISSRAHVAASAGLPEAVTVGAGAVIGERARLGERVSVGPGCVVGDDVAIGDDCLLHANVTIYPGCRLGSRVIVHSGTVIGSDGFGYATDEQGRHLKRPHVGIVQIDDDVEIGANVCVDRGTFGKTWIRRGAKIDNLVQIAHNVEVGEDALLVSQVGIAGSTSLGRHVVLGGQVGVGGHIRLGDRVMVAAKSGVHNDQPEGAVIAGIPAIAHRTWLRAVNVVAKLPDLQRDLRDLRRKVAALVKKVPIDDETP